ncbi:MAG TPA: carboxypeptidase regulatory-like domain-containing protein [Gemmatimonadaceae bacterium]|nr:carboxypeptidase regulatory-like domain-containing protein [Gemmatimonadaceae bacterium]
MLDTRARLFATQALLGLATGGALVAKSLTAQATTGSIEGTAELTGACPSPAQVAIRDQSTGAVRVTTTDGHGRYRVLALTPGRYDVLVRDLGCSPETRKSVDVLLGERTSVDFSMHRDTQEIAPVVITGARRGDVARSEVATTVTPEQIAALPLNSRNVLSIAALTPGTRSYALEAGRSIPLAGPTSIPRFDNLYIDGTEWKGVANGSLVGRPETGSLIPQDAVREFRVLLNPYDVELTRGASWIITAVTYQGGNELHGSLFDFGQNRGLVAKSTFQTEKPEYRRQQMGATLRGPLVKDHLFFAASYESQATDNFIDVVPGRPAVNPGIWDQYAGTFRAPTRNEMGTLRLTMPRGRHSLDASWAGRALSIETGFGIRSGAVMLGHDAGTAGRYRTNGMQLRDSYANGPLVNELTISGLALNQEDLPLLPGPTMRYPSLQRGIAGYPTIVSERHFGISNKLSRAIGSQHLLKSGLDISAIRAEGFQPSNADGFFMFTTDTSTLPQTARIAVGYLDPASTNDARYVATRTVIGAWLQDEFHPSESVTLTAGVRYDAELNGLGQGKHEPWANDTTLLRVVGANYLNDDDRKNDLNNLAPRVAATWNVAGDKRTFIRAGYGIMYERYPAFSAFNEQLSYQWRVYSFTRPGTTDPAELRRRVLAGTAGVAPNLTLLPDRLESPSTRQWSIGVGRRLSEHAAVNLDYIDQHLRNVYVGTRINGADPVTGARPLTNRYGDIQLWGDFGDATYRGLLSSLTYADAAVQLTVAYTLSWAASEFGNDIPGNFPDSSDYTMQRSDGDERHRVVVSGIKQLPFGMTLSGIGIIASPRAFLAFAGSDVNGNGSPSDDWPGGTRTAYRGGWNNWYRTLDLRLAKSIQFSPGALAVTAEVFNVFNTNNPSVYQATESLSNFRHAVAYYAPRQAQIGARYSF